ncbi:MAG: hypothetical protein ABFR35_08325 [Thermodesulfobacteriota bacterium]|jgi:hypothetical protein
MFDEMVSLLKKGKMVQIDLLRKRFDLALIKKIGVVKTPYSFWSADKKINPASKELLWAVILLEDRENFMLVEGIITTELDEHQKVSGHSNNDISVQQVIDIFIQELLQLSPSVKFRKFLEQKVKHTLP